MADKKSKKFNSFEGIVYSTNPDHEYNSENIEETETLLPGKQDLRVQLDKKHRGGKAVTLIKGFVGLADDLEKLGKKIKIKCGVGGSVKDGEIIVQGDFCDRIINLLKNEGFKVKRIGS